MQHPFVARHEQLWSWADGIELGVSAPPFMACWGRGGAKSTSAELIVVRWGAKKTRRYVLYLCETQEQADDHVGNVAGLLESAAIEKYHPHLADRLVGKFGQSKGWRRNRLRTSEGFTLDALGLDTAARGIKLEEMRPDAIIIDDVDGSEDSEAVTQKKIKTLTRKILPALTHDAAILFVQNMVHDDSMMAQVFDGRADFLGGAILSGPHPAIEGLEYSGSGTGAIITRGTATWAGQSLEDCQRFIQKWGLDAFLSECQHESVAQSGRFLASIALWDACREELPPLDPHTPCVLSMDAGESSDTFATGLISRHPRDPSRFAVRYSRIYVPEHGQPLDFDAIEEDIRTLVKQYAISEVCYDRFLLGQMMRRFQGNRPLPAPLEPFSQAGDRLEADRALKDAIIARRLAHHGDAVLREHLDNANAKSSADGRQLRIVKRSGAKKIDGAVMLAMGLARAGEVLPAVQATIRRAPTANRWKGY